MFDGVMQRNSYGVNEQDRVTDGRTDGQRGREEAEGEGVEEVERERERKW